MPNIFDETPEEREARREAARKAGKLVQAKIVMEVSFDDLMKALRDNPELDTKLTGGKTNGNSIG